MPDFRELFTSDDFAAYQSLVVDEVVVWLEKQLSVARHVETINEGMNLAERILKIPMLKLEPNSPIARKLYAAVKARLIEIPTKLMAKEMF